MERFRSPMRIELTSALGRSIPDIATHLAVDLAQDELDIEFEQPDAPQDVPDVLFTTLVGAKGLSAEHVFVIGMNNGYLPKDSGSMTKRRSAASWLHLAVHVSSAI